MVIEAVNVKALPYDQPTGPRPAGKSVRLSHKAPQKAKKKSVVEKIGKKWKKSIGSRLPTKKAYTMKAYKERRGKK